MYDFGRNEHYEKYKEYYVAKSRRKRRYRKYIRKNPSNGNTPDCVDMMRRNKDRYNYGLELNME